MRSIWLAGCGLVLVSACTMGAPADEGVIAEVPVPVALFTCADGRRVDLWAFLGGVIVVVDGEAHTLPELVAGDRPGNYHQDETLGWVSLPDRQTGLLADLAPGQSVLDAATVTCRRDAEQPPG